MSYTIDDRADRMRRKLHAAINVRRPQNGFITGLWILEGYTAQPDYTFQVRNLEP